MMTENKRVTIPDVLILVLGLVLGIGVKFVFHACKSTMESGMYMSCHWAEQMVAALGFLIFLQAVLILVFGAKVRLGISFSIIPTALLSVITPGVLINLCMKTDMHCHAVMRPAVIIIGILIIIAACVNVIIEWRKEK